MAFFHRKLLCETILAPVILLIRFFRVSPRHCIVSACFPISIFTVTTTKCYVGTASRYDVAELQRAKLHIRYRPRKPEHKNGWWIINTLFVWHAWLYVWYTFEHLTHKSEGLPPPHPPPHPREILLHALKVSVLSSMLSSFPRFNSSLPTTFPTPSKNEMRLLTQVILRRFQSARIEQDTYTHLSSWTSGANLYAWIIAPGCYLCLSLGVIGRHR